MICTNCAAVHDRINLEYCQTCQTLHDLGMLSTATIPISIVVIDSITEVKKPEEKYDSNYEPLTQKERFDISQLFVDSNIPSDQIETKEVKLADFEQILYDNQKTEADKQQMIIEVQRPQLLVEMQDEPDMHRINHLATLDAKLNNSIDNIFKMIDAQCAAEGLSHYETVRMKEEQLTAMILKYKREQADLRQQEMTTFRRRSRLKAEELERLSPEEQEDFRYRAVKSYSPDQLRKKEQKAAEKRELAVSKSLMDIAVRRVKMGKSKTIEDALEFVTRAMEI